MRADDQEEVGRWGARERTALALCLVAVIAALSAAIIVRVTTGGSPPIPVASLSRGANPDPAGRLPRPAPDFTLTDQFGQTISLRAFRGRPVVLAFIDSQCTTICPLTTTAMVEAKNLVGQGGSRVQLLGVDANPTAIAIRDVRAYSTAHGMLHQWHFLTGSLPELKRVWRAYGIEAQVVGGQVDHTPALFVIDSHGTLRNVYMTAMAYAGIGQQAQLIAQELSSLLPGRPRVRANPAEEVQLVQPPTMPVSLPRVGGGTVRLGPGRSPRLLLFFATWAAETSDLSAGLQMLNRYQSLAIASGLPRLTGVDEASVEPSPSALPRFLHHLRHPLSYPVAVDQSGRVADGYEVEDQPWLVLVSRTGRFLYYRDVSTAGWPTPSQLARLLREALALGGSR
jgi:cytochrome oxidase Cu insertion factor (SCO1/SenC/PrrC family)